jgi:hypothetical protein
MKSLKMKQLAALILVSATAFSGAAKAESVLDTATAFSAAARHDFLVVIPAFLFFGVGPGALTPMVANAGIGAITFTVPAANVGNSTPVAGTGGDAAASAANVRVIGNNGQVTLTASNDGGGNGLGTGVPADGFIALTQISTTASNAALPAPALNNAGGTTSLPTVAGKVTNQAGTWTYSYLNTVTPAAGTYGGVGRGRVTYTATMP